MGSAEAVGSPYTPAQRAKDQSLAADGGTPAGRNAADAGITRPVRLKTKVVRLP